jgi:hypothetical protein
VAEAETEAGLSLSDSGEPPDTALGEGDDSAPPLEVEAQVQLSGGTGAEDQPAGDATADEVTLQPAPALDQELLDTGQALGGVTERAVENAPSATEEEDTEAQTHERHPARNDDEQGQG